MIMKFTSIVFLLLVAAFYCAAADKKVEVIKSEGNGLKTVKDAVIGDGTTAELVKAPFSSSKEDSSSSSEESKEDSSSSSSEEDSSSSSSEEDSSSSSEESKEDSSSSSSEEESARPSSRPTAGPSAKPSSAAPTSQAPITSTPSTTAPISQAPITSAPSTTAPPSGKCDVTCNPNDLEDKYRVNPADCGSFYECSNGVPILQPCPENLVFNPILNVCDHPDRAPPCTPTCTSVMLHFVLDGQWVRESVVKNIQTKI